jgi:hypothetical protein
VSTTFAAKGTKSGESPRARGRNKGEEGDAQADAAEVGGGGNPVVGGRAAGTKSGDGLRAPLPSPTADAPGRPEEKAEKGADGELAPLLKALGG